MISQKELDLLIDVQKLIRKYGEDTFTRLSNNLNGEDFINSIKLLGKSFPVIKETSRDTKIKTNYQDKLDQVIVNLSKKDSGKHKILTILIKELEHKKYFSAVKEFSSYLNEAGIYQSKITTWIQGKYILINYLSEKNISYIKSCIEYLEDEKSGKERSLDAWSNVILNEDKRANK